MRKKLMLFILICLFVFAAWHFGLRRFWEEKRSIKTYKNQEYGFSFQYPGDLKIKSLGPNSSMQQLKENEMISGTVTPRYDTITFSAPDDDEQFSLAIFGPNVGSLKSENYKASFYLHDSCDLRWITPIPQINTHELNTNGVQILEVLLSHPSLYAKCCYFKSGKGYFVSLYTPIYKNQSELQKASPIFQKILSTLSY